MLIEDKIASPHHLRTPGTPLQQQQPQSPNPTRTARSCVETSLRHISEEDTLPNDNVWEDVRKKKTLRPNHCALEPKNSASSTTSTRIGIRASRRPCRRRPVSTRVLRRRGTCMRHRAPLDGSDCAVGDNTSLEPAPNIAHESVDTGSWGATPGR